MLKKIKKAEALGSKVTTTAVSAEDVAHLGHGGLCLRCPV